MLKEIFISYCSENADAAEKICDSIESNGNACWIAPRDVMPGTIYAEQIIKAIKAAKILVLICSSHTYKSAHVRNEVERAFSQGKTIFPFRMEDAPLGEALEYFLATSQWIEAWKPPFDEKKQLLLDSVADSVGGPKTRSCPSCDSENGQRAKFCAHCGSELGLACPECGHKLAPDAKFCERCGAAQGGLEISLAEQFDEMQETFSPSVKRRLSVAADGENRLVTVLYADMTEPVKTAGDLDAEDAAELVNRMLATIIDVLSGHECRIDRIVGNEVMAVFGAPLTHEDDAVRALNAAIEVRDEVNKLGMRISIGVNTGQVYFGPMGSAEGRRTTVVGAPVDMAVRLQGEAGVNEIVVGKVTHRQARKSFQFEPLSVVVKGLDEPEEAYRVARVLLKQDKARGLEGMRTELIGRDEELGKLKSAFEKAIMGAGQMVSIIGEAGIGKSRLVAELKGHAENLEAHRRIRFFEGRCIEHGSSASYLPFLDLFRAYFGWSFGETDEDRAAKILRSLKELGKNGHLTGGRIDEIAPLFGALLSIRGNEEWRKRLLVIKEQIKQKTFAAIQELLGGLSRDLPLVVVLEDLHWADDISLDLIPMLMEILADSRILLLCVYRAEGKTATGHLSRTAEQKCKENYTEIRLHDLNRDQSRRMVDSLLRIENLAARLKDAIFDRAQGNPFFVEEVVRSFIDEGMVYSDGKKWQASANITSATVPESVQSVILGRVDKLPGELKELLRVPSAMGRLFKPSVLKRILGPDENVDDGLYELEERWLVYLERTVPEPEYSFKHALTRETVYNGMLKRGRAALHREVATAMEDLYSFEIEEYYEDLAYHYGRADVPDKAVEYLQKAGERAIRFSANEEGVEHLRNALSLLQKLPQGPERNQRELSLQLQFYAPLSAMKGYGHPDVMNATERAYELSESSESQVQQFLTVYGLLGSNMVRGDFYKTEALAIRFLEIAEEDKNPDHLLEAHRMMDETLHLKGDYREAIEHNNKVYPLYNPDKHRAHAYVYGQEPATQNYSFKSLGMWFLGYPEKARQAIDSAYECIKDFNHPHSRSMVLAIEGQLDVLMRDWKTGMVHIEKTIAFCNQHNLPFSALWTTCYSGLCRVMLERNDRGIQEMTEGFETIRSVGAEIFVAMYLPYRAEALGSIGELDNALKVAEEADEVIERTGVRWSETELLRIKGDLLLAVGGRAEEAGDYLNRAIDMARKKQARSLELRATMSLSRLLRDRGDPAEAHRILADIYSWFTEGFDTPDLKEAKALLSDLS